MKPDLGPALTVEYNGYPPGMPAGDLIIWSRYQSALAGLYDKLYFNVRVGEPVLFDPDIPPEFAKMATDLSRRRIDVVAENSQCWFLMELKWDAGIESFGQILAYKTLWSSDPPDSRPVKIAIVTNRADRNLIFICKVYGIELIIV